MAVFVEADVLGARDLTTASLSVDVLGQEEALDPLVADAGLYSSLIA